MCGIVGYIGSKDVSSVLMAGLWKLEYRGYDSSGIATIENSELGVRKTFGKLMRLQELLTKEPLGGDVGIGHTRWATHGEPSEQNAHPQVDCEGKIAIVHNGIIENYYTLRDRLKKSKHIFKSNTDTEVIAHLIEENYKGNLKNAVLKTVKMLKGSFAFAVISSKEPGKIIAYRKGSPLIIGIGKGENLLASDIPAVIGHTRSIIVMDDDELAVLTKNSVSFFNKDGKKIQKKIRKVPYKSADLEKGGFPHYMLKEIFEQPAVIRDNLNIRLKNSKIILGDSFHFTPDSIASINNIFIQACGTSWHAGYIGKYILEKLARIHTEVDISSEFRYRNPVISGETLVIAVSQSGETADTLAGLREAKAKFLRVLSFVNTPGSTIARESDGVIYVNAGPEIGVASTKAFVAQIFNLYLFTLYLSRIKWTITKEEMLRRIKELNKIPKIIEDVLKLDPEIKKIAESLKEKKNFIFLGRGINYPTALEGALKLKEISYIYASGYPAGELKHGPLALVDEDIPIVAIATKSDVYEKMLSNLEEVKSRKGKIIAIATKGDKKIKDIADSVLYIPDIMKEISPIPAVIPLQLFAYHMANLNGRDVDKPRNLAKSVTVE